MSPSTEKLHKANVVLDTPIQKPRPNIARLSSIRYGSFDAKKPITPWLITKWSPEQSRKMYCKWGHYFMHHSRTDQAYDCFNKSISYGLDRDVLYERSRCKREMWEAEKSLDDSILAAELGDPKSIYDYEVFLSLYESNRFEDAAIKLCEYLERYKGKTQFQIGLDLIHGHFEDQLGDSLSKFILHHENVFPIAMKLLKKSRRKDDKRPLWKIKREKEECDVLSIIEKKNAKISPLERARRMLAFKVYNQKCFKTTWKDITFINDIVRHPAFFLEQTQGSTVQLKQLSCQTYKAIKKVMKMYQARCPMYFEENNRCPNKKKCDEVRKNSLFRIQYQTRRTANKILQSVNEYRSNGDFKNLAKLVENVLSKYVVLKTYRVLPWKFEFITKIINSFGMTIIEGLQIPDNLNDIEPQNQLLSVFNLLQDREYKLFVFGKRSTYSNILLIEKVANIYKNEVKHLKDRMRFVEFDIEKSYLYHEISRKHLEYGHYSKCVQSAKMGKTEAKNCGSILWAFLNVILELKSYVSQHKLEHINYTLDVASELAPRLNNSKLISFIDVCRQMNEMHKAVKAKDTKSFI